MKRLIALLLALIMVVSLCPTLSIHAHAADDCPIPGATGAGTEADPVVVDTVEELTAALEYNGDLHILVETDLSTTVDYAFVYSKGNKVLTLNSTLDIKQNNADSAIYIPGGGSLTLKGNGTLQSTHNTLRVNGTLTVEGTVTVTNTSASYEDVSYYGVSVYGTANFKGGSFRRVRIESTGSATLIGGYFESFYCYTAGAATLPAGYFIQGDDGFIYSSADSFYNGKIIYTTDVIPGATGTGTEADPLVVDSAAELKAALEYNGDLHILVEDDIEVTVDWDFADVLGNKVLTVNSNVIIQNGSDDAFYVYSGASLTLKGTGLVQSTNMTFQVNGTLTVEGDISVATTFAEAGYISGYCVYADEGTVYFKGGTFRRVQVSSSASATLTGGTFECYANYGSTTLPKNYYLVDSNGNYRDKLVSGDYFNNVKVVYSTDIIPGATGTGTEADPIVVDTAAELKAALEYDGDLYILVETDLAGSGSYSWCTTKGNKVLTVNSSLSFTNSSSGSLITVPTGASLTIRGTGTLTSTYRTLKVNGTLTVDGTVTITTGQTQPSYSSSYCIDIYGLGYLKGGTIGMVYVEPGSVVTFSGGSYKRIQNSGIVKLGEDCYFMASDGSLSSDTSFSFKQNVEVANFANVLVFATRSPAVSEAEAAAGTTDLGTISEYPTFSFTARALPEAYAKAGYTLALKTEAWQGDIPVYTADNGNVYTHNYAYQGKVVMTITLLKPDGTAMFSKSHTYTFDLRIPATGIALDAEYASLTSGSMQGITATLTPADSTDTITWTSSDENIVTVSDGGSVGTLTALRPGSAIITATTESGMKAYCVVQVKDADTIVFVGNVGLADGEYLAAGSSVPTTTKPVGAYAYAALTSNGKVNLTLHDFTYSGHGTFVSQSIASGIYSDKYLTLIPEGTSTVGPVEVPVTGAACIGIYCSGSSLAISSGESDKLTVTGTATGVRFNSGLMVEGNLDITDASTNGIYGGTSQTDGLFIKSGSLNISDTATGILMPRGMVYLTGGAIDIRATTGISLTDAGIMDITGGILNIRAVNGIRAQNQNARVKGGTVTVDADDIALTFKSLIISSGKLLAKSRNVENDVTNCAVYAPNGITVEDGMIALASEHWTGAQAVEFDASKADTYDYIYAAADADTHDHYLIHHEKTEPTCYDTGSIEYWECGICGICFADSAAATYVSDIDAIILVILPHDWKDADCENPKTCARCGLTDGDPLGHSWTAADCDTPKTCSVCGATEGDPLGHDWQEADCDTPKTCSRCGATEGAPKGHTWVAADCDTPKTCSVCGATEGSALGHDYTDGTCTRCGAADPDYEAPTDPTDPVAPVLSGVIRIAGADRIGTSLMLADQLKEVLGVPKFDAVVVASALNFPDALTGSYLAAVKKAPILLTYDAAHAKVTEYIVNNLKPGGSVYVLGGESAVSAGFMNGLAAKGILANRVAGSDRFGTNLAIMKEAGVSASQPILIATALNFADSLSASAAGLPMVLVYGSLRADQKEFLAATSKNFIIIGGTSAVSEALEAELEAIGSVERLAGSGRYQTSVMVAQKFVTNPDDVVLAYARNFPDGLCGGPLAYALGAPLILTDNYDPSEADKYVDGITAGIVVGGVGLISDEAARAIFDLAANAPIQPK